MVFNQVLACKSIGFELQNLCFQVQKAMLLTRKTIGFRNENEDKNLIFHLILGF